MTPPPLPPSPLAAKFTRTGTISISAGVSNDGNRLYVSVTDTGVGIPRDKIGKIFGAFEQVWGKV